MSFIRLDSVTVDFPIYKTPNRSLKKRLLNITMGGAINNHHNDLIIVRALDNVSLNIENGDRVGIVGHNGAGKSTLLRVLSNIYEPTKGKIHFNGKVSSLLDVMLGINSESTGYENIFIRGLLLGLTYKEIAAKAEEIAEFTGLGEFLYMPIRTYSSGMAMRLAFAVATSIQPDILLMDEIIGVGDKNFFVQAEQRLRSLIDKSNIVILASHSKDIIHKICNKILVMQKGQLHWFGHIEDAFHDKNIAATAGWI